MKPQFVLLGLAFVIGARAQTNVDLWAPLPAILTGPSSFEGPMSSLRGGAWGKAATFVVDIPKPCPLEYTNVLSNTNLFTPDEQILLKELPSKYGNMIMDTPPPGTRLVGREPGKNLLVAFTIARYQPTNSEGQIRAFYWETNLLGAGFIAKSGDGYEFSFDQDGQLIGFRAVKQGKLDGLWADFSKGRCVDWMRFKDGKAVGKYLVWNAGGTLYMEADFKEPYDFFAPFVIHGP